MKHREKVDHLLRLERVRLRIQFVRNRCDVSPVASVELNSALSALDPIRLQLLSEVRNTRVKR